MTKTELIKIVAKRTGISSKEVNIVIDTFFKELSQSLRTEDISIKDFGTLKKVTQAPHQARNPQTGELIMVPEKEVVKFKPSKNILNMNWL